MEITFQISEHPLPIDHIYIKTLTLLIPLVEGELPFAGFHYAIQYLNKHPLITTFMKMKDKYIGKFHKVALGGTFDHLHLGHQILLLRALILAKDELYVGVTSDHMIRHKKNKEIIEPCQLRIEKIKTFLQHTESKIKITVEMITDPFGPPIHDDEFDCLVVSEETIKGGEKINQIRVQKQMKELELVVIPAFSVHEHSTVENKISSTTIRNHLLTHNHMTIQDVQEYQQYWQGTFNLLSQVCEVELAQSDVSSEWFELFHRYSQYWRYYHTNQHILSLLRAYYQLKLELTPREEVILLLAIWYHDVQYVPSQKNNQSISAQIAADMIEKLVGKSQMRDNIVEGVRKSIMVTLDHKGENQVQKILVQLDMGILNSPLEVYQVYAKQIRQEYEPLVGQQFPPKRIQFLKTVIPESLFSDPSNMVHNIQWQITYLSSSEL